MAYQVSARKWRPQNFNEVVGQGHVVQTLRNAILSNRVGHAYLFSGKRGVGKTSVARIFAKALNCVNGPTSEPCNNCEMCREITGGFCSDVIEIDGASNTGVDDVRELRESVKYASSKGRYKVYIVDEVHMLSKSAFNAFLKTLEEPPGHIVFIFATTEPNRIPETIISRCQYFEFKGMSIKDTVEQLKQIAEREGINISKEILTLIAKSAEGSMRDALVSLDQIVSFCGDVIREEDVKMILGLVGREALSSLMNNIKKRDILQIVRFVRDLSIQGVDLRVFCKEFLEHIRNIMVVKITDNPASLIELPDTEIESFKSEAEDISMEELQLMFNIILKAESDIRQTSQPLLILEMAFINMTEVGKILTVGEIVKRLDKVKLVSGEINRSDVNQKPHLGASVGASPVKSGTESFENNDLSSSAADDVSLWIKIKESLGTKKPLLGGILENMKISRIGVDEIVLNFAGNASESFHRQVIDSNQDVIRDTLKEIMGRDLKITLENLPGKESSKGFAITNSGIEEWKKKKVQEVLDIIPGVIINEISGDKHGGAL